MVFNGDANEMDLCGLADTMAKTDDTDFPLREKAMYGNWGIREIVKEILKVYGGWTFDDSNNSGEPIALANLLDDGTQFYAFAAVGWIAGVEYEDDNGNRFKLSPITLEEIREMGYAEDEFYETPGTPIYYRPVKNGIKIYPSSDTAVTNGLVVHIGSRDITPFTPSSTSVSPGYDSLGGHEAVASFMAWKYASINTLDSAAALFSDWITALKGVKDYYAGKFSREKKPVLRKGNTSSGTGYVDQFVS